MSEETIVTAIEPQGESVEPAEIKAESPPAEQQTEQSEKPKIDPVQRRIDRLTREKYQARAELDQLRKQVEQLSQSRQPTQVQGAPKLEQFQSFDEYVLAAAEYKAEEKFRSLTQAQQRQQQEQVAQQKTQETAKSWEKRVADVRKTIPEYDDIIASAEDVPINEHIGQAILESDMGPQVALYLARNPEEAEALLDKSPSAVARAIGRIEARLESEALTQKQSAAPKPAKPVGGNATAPKTLADVSDFDEFTKLRRKQIANRR